MNKKYEAIRPELAHWVDKLVDSLNQLEVENSPENWDIAYDAYRDAHRFIVDEWNAAGQSTLPDWLQRIWDSISSPEFGVYNVLYAAKENGGQIQRRLRLKIQALEEWKVKQG